MFPVKLNAPDMHMFDWPEWYHTCLVDQENDDIWVPVYLGWISDADANSLYRAGHLLFVESPNRVIDGKPYCSARAYCALKGGCEPMDAHRQEVLSKFRRSA